MNTRSIRQKNPTRRAAHVESLETRVMLTTYAVLKTDDGSDGSLRQAILEANANPGPDAIHFAIGSGSQTIRPVSALPEITDPLVIDGTTQPGYAAGGAPVIELDGTLAGTTANGLNIIAADVTVRGLTVNRFAFNGIRIAGDRAVVEGSYIGTDAAGAAAAANGWGTNDDIANGVRLSGSQFSRIGTDGDGAADAAERNVISGNRMDGVRIDGARALGNRVAGNYVGTDATGAAPPGNGWVGVEVIGGADQNVIGIDGNGSAGDAAEGNVISANGVHGVHVLIAGTSGNVVAGNLIGTDTTGTQPLGNGVDGVKVSNVAPNNRVGTNGDGVADALERNVIADNGEAGVRLGNAQTTGNVVAGNYIGTDVTGTQPIGNFLYGVFISGGAAFNHIGTDGNGLADAAERNVISASLTGHGVTIDTSNNNDVAGNYIGTDVSGAGSLGNFGAGVSISGGSDNRIGMTGLTDVARANTIAYNGGIGVNVRVSSASPTVTPTGNTIRGNSIHGNGWRFTPDPLPEGIRLGSGGGAANDYLDTDTGSNGLTNSPTVLSVTTGATTTVNGKMEGSAWHATPRNIAGRVGL